LEGWVLASAGAGYLRRVPVVVGVRIRRFAAVEL
jgi:hypothetical protein